MPAIICTNITNGELSFGAADLLEWLREQSLPYRALWYLVSPEEAFMTNDGSEYIDMANITVPAFRNLIIIQGIFLLIVGRKILHPSEVIVNVGQGMIMQVIRLIVGLGEFYLYDQVYNRWHWIDASRWDQWDTWIFGAIFFDLCFYVFHRMGHEVHLFWAMHQVHHSSEEYNLSVSLRLSHFHDFVHFGLIYVPLALFGVPTKVCFIHKTLNLLFQFWLHSEYCPKLGPIEWIFITPSHHRVHHGRNTKYLDRNYGGFLVIWDRLFGTYQEEEETPSYGITKQINTFDTFYIQLHQFREIYRNVRDREGYRNKLYSIIKGPGWEPGSPWTGWTHKVPPTKPERPRFRAQISLFWVGYTWLQFAPFAAVYGEVVQYYHDMHRSSLVFILVYMYAFLEALGFIFDKRWFAPHFEVVRCVIFILMRPIFLEVYSVAHATPLKEMEYNQTEMSCPIFRQLHRDF
ncbi:alkylglycerol monooxygenase-like isoform X2 [Varroa destructor]|uniref:Alkylglycerol monooxygenase n=1 Tax=Varroa destructor TaxID=109461 RepID=A0A7M7L1J1_VARDE|nr:alkylglycerol monooxygenase-like isoform X2 [Varroa destructor]